MAFDDAGGCARGCLDVFVMIVTHPGPSRPGVVVAASTGRGRRRDDIPRRPKGSLVSVEDVQTTVTAMFSAVKMYFLATPTKTD